MAATNKQSGSFLIEFILVAALTLILTIWGSAELVERSKNLQAQSLANWMGMAHSGIQNYLDKSHVEIMNLVITHGLDEYNQSFKPSWQDLISAGFINQAWNLTGPAKLEIGYKLVLDEACEKNNCRILALIYTTQGFKTKEGKIDNAFIANWLLAANGKGLVYRVGNQYNGFKGAGVSLATSSELFESGALALLAEKSVFIGPDIGNGENPQDDNLNPDSEIEPQPDIDTEKFLMVRDERDPDFQGDVTIQGKVHSQSQIQTKEGLILNRTYEIYDDCVHEGEITSYKKFIGLLVCKDNKRQLASYPFGGGYMLNSKKGCINSTGQSTANPITGGCNCPLNHIGVQISESGSLTDKNGLSAGFVCLVR